MHLQYEEECAWTGLNKGFFEFQLKELSSKKWNIMASENLQSTEKSFLGKMVCKEVNEFILFQRNPMSVYL